MACVMRKDPDYKSIPMFSLSMDCNFLKHNSSTNYLENDFTQKLIDDAYQNMQCN